MDRPLRREPKGPSKSQMSKWKQILFASSPRNLDVALLLLRVGFGLSMALAHGLGKARDIPGFSAKIAARVPLPELLGPAAALSEFLGGLLVALGLFTRPAAAFVLITMGVAAFHIHAADPFSKKELALAHGLVALAIAIAGPGRFSLDARLFGRSARLPVDAG
ncbi:MAG: hypothetical protein AMXMBFR56_44450 [Polyangiaceae bacterium]